jgi:adenine-specific DNA-methyltransferase
MEDRLRESSKLCRDCALLSPEQPRNECYCKAARDFLSLSESRVIVAHVPKKSLLHASFLPTNRVTLCTNDCLSFLNTLPDECAQLVLTSPPYNIGKNYERDRVSIDEYTTAQKKVIDECVRIVKPGGSICWQVGHHVNGHAQIIPLDILLYPCFQRHEAKQKLYLRNRIIWHFEFGCHSQRRFSGRHEVILWFTKGDEYTFHLDRVRVPQKYPGKRGYRGARKGQYSGNPLGKNPGDVWIFPNVKGKHIEKTIHPCQFPVELAERLIESLTDKSDLVVDPYVGVGSTVAAAILHARRAAGCDAVAEYVRIARRRVKLAAQGTLPYRPRFRLVYKPKANSALTIVPDMFAYVSPNAPALSKGSRLVPTNNRRLPIPAAAVFRNGG